MRPDDIHINMCIISNGNQLFSESGELLIFIFFIDLNANAILLVTSSAIGEQTAYLSGASAKR
jgi:hypothetical protein